MPISWTGSSGHTYDLYKTPMTWASAKIYAESVGGYLAKVETAAEK